MKTIKLIHPDEKFQENSLTLQGNASEHPIGKIRNSLVISTRKVSGRWHVVSIYGDEIWWPTGKPTNLPNSRAKLDFTKFPLSFRESMKEVVFRYLRRGMSGGRRPRASTLASRFSDMVQFINFVSSLGIEKISDIPRLACINYKGAASKNKKKPNTKIEKSTLCRKLQAVLAIFELSQHTSDPMPNHPWPDSSAGHMAGSKGKGNRKGGLTPLIPDWIFVRIFQEAWEIVECAPLLLDWRDKLQQFAETKSHLHHKSVTMQKSKLLENLGFNGNYFSFTAKLREIRTACYVVIATLSGCRNHELGYLRSNSCHSTTDDDGEQYWWMRSVSTKTEAGATEWMIPDAAVTAIKILERWAEPYQASLRREIAHLRSDGIDELRLAEALEHENALFVGVDTKKGGLVRTLGTHPMNLKLKEFTESLGLNWSLATHQFRRKFANYAARSQFGDLRYLKEHFKHWSMDMTLGYALNESQEMDLYLEISYELDEIKEGLVSSWLDKSEPLAGGYGDNLADWRSREESIILFKNRSDMVKAIAQSTHIRSNGHAWCTADDNRCIGNNLEVTRCGSGCSNAVIGRQHATIYQGLISHLEELEFCEDIGPTGRERVKRDLNRCRNVLHKLGHHVEEVLV